MSEIINEKDLSQVSGGSRTSVGGYAGYSPEERPHDTEQFDVSDQRSLDEAVRLTKAISSITLADYEVADALAVFNGEKDFTL